MVVVIVYVMILLFCLRFLIVIRCSVYVGYVFFLMIWLYPVSTLLLYSSRFRSLLTLLYGLHVYLVCCLLLASASRSRSHPRRSDWKRTRLLTCPNSSALLGFPFTPTFLKSTRIESTHKVKHQVYTFNTINRLQTI